MEYSKIVCDRNEVIGKSRLPGTYVFGGTFGAKKVAVKRLEKWSFHNVTKNSLAAYISPNESKHPNIVQYYAIEHDQDFWLDSIYILQLFNYLLP
jgi:hypothetical protein